MELGWKIAIISILGLATIFSFIWAFSKDKPRSDVPQDQPDKKINPFSRAFDFITTYFFIGIGILLMGGIVLGMISTGASLFYGLFIDPILAIVNLIKSIF